MLAAAFGTISSTQGRLEELQGNYSPRLGNLRESLGQTLQRCGQPCAGVSPNGVTFTANYSTVRTGRGSRWLSPTHPIAHEPAALSPQALPRRSPAWSSSWRRWGRCWAPASQVIWRR